VLVPASHWWAVVAALVARSRQRRVSQAPGSWCRTCRSPCKCTHRRPSWRWRSTPPTKSRWRTLSCGWKRSSAHEQPVGLRNRRLQIGRSGPFSPPSCPIAELGVANAAKTVLAGADFRFRRPKSDRPLAGPRKVGALLLAYAQAESRRLRILLTRGPILGLRALPRSPYWSTAALLNPTSNRSPCNLLNLSGPVKAPSRALRGHAAQSKRLQTLRHTAILRREPKSGTGS